LEENKGANTIGWEGVGSSKAYLPRKRRTNDCTKFGGGKRAKSGAAG